jgi:hypothetical protein
VWSQFRLLQQAHLVSELPALIRKAAVFHRLGRITAELELLAHVLERVQVRVDAMLELGSWNQKRAAQAQHAVGAVDHAAGSSGLDRWTRMAVSGGARAQESLSRGDVDLVALLQRPDVALIVSVVGLLVTVLALVITVRSLRRRELRWLIISISLIEDFGSSLGDLKVFFEGKPVEIYRLHGWRCGTQVRKSSNLIMTLLLQIH